MKQRYIMSHELARQRAIDAVRNAPSGCVIEVHEPTRRKLCRVSMAALSWSAAKPAA